MTYSFSNSATAPARLTSIQSSDGRQITLSYNAAGKIASASDGSRSWSYQYANGSLSAVVLPDASRWTIDFAQLSRSEIEYDNEPGAPRSCDTTAPINGISDGSGALFGSVTGRITHPSGALGEFEVGVVYHGRSNVPKACINWESPFNDPQNDVATWPKNHDLIGLKRKRVTGPGLTAMEWLYSAGATRSWAAGTGPTCTTLDCAAPKCLSDDCAGTAVTTVNGPNGEWTRFIHGNSYRYNEGKLLKVERGGGSTTLRTETTTYVLAQSGQPFKTPIGTSPQSRGDGFTSEYLRPQLSRTISQDGVNFTWEVPQDCLLPGGTCMDPMARPRHVRKHSTLGFSRLDIIYYHDDASRWVMGQVAKEVCQQAQPADTYCDGDVVSESGFDSLARPTWHRAYGKLQHTLSYHADGTLASYKDGRNYVTSLSNWYRGVPRSIAWPDGTSVSAAVNANGTVASATDENGYKTCYAYDAMGRLSKVTHPSESQTGVCDTSAWNPTTQAFVQVNGTEYGIAAGHWRQTVQTGNGVKINYFDALWRPLVAREYDAGAVSATQRFTRFAYDHAGRNTFASYPSTSSSPTTGIWTEYDPLGRATSVSQDSEQGLLTTLNEYLTGFHTRVTNPRGFKTTTSQYLAYDEPTTEWPLKLAHPEGAYTDIVRNVFGKPTWLIRRNADSSLRVERRYFYNSYQELCRVMEPETRGNLMGYDAAGNLAWSASGLHPSTACNSAGSTAEIQARKVSRYYDARNRLTSMQMPDGNGTQDWTYAPDGLPTKIITYNDGGTTAAVNHYSYNRRRLMTADNFEYPNWYSWGIASTYNANGHLASHTYPSGQNVAYAPNALGQPTRAGSYATGVSYHPNGAIKQFTYGNGLVHSMTQNARQLPLRVIDSGNALDHDYRYDANGNPAQIYDYVTGTPTQQHRYLNYDGLDRLTGAGSQMFGGDHWHRYTYDALDNLKSWKLAGVKDYASYDYDANHRLTNIRNSSGASIVGLGYDVQGNLANKNGQGYVFDYGNRMRSASGIETYRYDGHGRRIQRVPAGGGTLISQYSADGKLMYHRDVRSGKNTRTDYIYLGGSQVAAREHNLANGVIMVRYQHTDALGSPVAVTNTSGQVVERTNWEPYGAAIGKPSYEGVGYTGHVMDGATGLAYMQQRYYDPQVGRFLSVDPVTANSGTGSNFNRYWYANNNPYRFKDPDGRLACSGGNFDCLRQRQELEQRGIPTWQAGASSPNAKKQDKPSGAGYTNPTGKARRGCDGYGCGHNGARRDGGRRQHLGADYIATPGQAVVSPTDGRVDRQSSPYRNDPKYTGLLIRGADGNTLQMWYITPASGIVGDTVSQGQNIGVAQDLQEKYGSKMTNHVHLRITSPEGFNIDPATLIPDP